LSFLCCFCYYYDLVSVSVTPFMCLCMFSMSFCLHWFSCFILFFSFFYVFMNLNVWSWFKIAVRSIKDFEVSIIVLESQFQLRWYKVPECSCNCDHNLKPWIWSLTSDNNGISEEKFFVLFCVVWLERESMEEAMLSNQTSWNILSCFYLFLIFFCFLFAVMSYKVWFISLLLFVFFSVSSYRIFCYFFFFVIGFT
jgi:hypothetical protein